MTPDLSVRAHVCDTTVCRRVGCVCCSLAHQPEYEVQLLKIKANKHGHESNLSWNCHPPKIKNTKPDFDSEQNCDFRSLTEKRPFNISIRNLFCLQRNVYILCILSLMCANVLADSNSCDFIGSGLDMDTNGVHSVYLTCAAGQVTWQYPRAALRIIFRLPQSSKEFRGCIKASPEIDGARVFLEGYRTLVPLFAADDGQPRSRVRCFTSYKGQAALYVEAEPSLGGFKRQSVSFEYDLRPMEHGQQLYDPYDECRPCSDSELLSLYCSADYVAKGRIIQAQDDEPMSRTTITFKAAKVFQQTTPLFSKAVFPNFSPEEEFNAYQSNDQSIPELQGTVQLHVPLHCGAHAGPGEFLVLGAVRLGEPILKCAPRLEQWVKLARKSRSVAHCALEV